MITKLQITGKLHYHRKCDFQLSKRKLGYRTLLPLTAPISLSGKVLCNFWIDFCCLFNKHRLDLHARRFHAAVGLGDETRRNLERKRGDWRNPFSVAWPITKSRHWVRWHLGEMGQLTCHSQSRQLPTVCVAFFVCMCVCLCVCPYCRITWQKTYLSLTRRARHTVEYNGR